MPFYDKQDAPYQFALISVNLANGVYSISNELLQNTGNEEFVGNNWLKTNQNTAVPKEGPRLGLIGAVFFTMGSYYGLFYLTPIFAILLLISSERISSNLFGKYVGFLTLIILATSNLLFRNSIRLQSDVVFSFIILWAFFFLIKYFRGSKEKYLFFSTVLFAFGAIVRLNGIVFLPVEIIFLIGIFVFQKYNSGKKIPNKVRKYLKVTLYLCVPWLVVVSGFLIYNEHYFGTPVVTHLELNKSKNYESEPISLIQFEKQDFENLKAYSKYLLPYQFPAVYNSLDSNYDSVLGKNWLGIISTILLSAILIVSLKIKQKRLEIIILFLMILAHVWFFSAITTENRAEAGVAGRFMIPVFTFSSMMISFLIITGLKSNYFKNNVTRIVIKILKLLFVGIIVIFIVGAFYYSNPVQIIAENGVEFKNPQPYAARYPLDMEGLTKSSVILARNMDYALDYGVIPMKLAVPYAISDDSVILLKKILQDGYDVYVFKDSTKKQYTQKDSLRVLINEHGFIIKDHSKSFCKILIGEEGKFQKTDDICLKI